MTATLSTPAPALTRCTRGHEYEGSDTRLCPTCGAPSASAVAEERAAGWKRLAWALPLALAIPATAILIGELGVFPDGVPPLAAIFAFIASWVWLGGIVNTIAGFVTVLFARPIVTRRLRKAT